LTINPNSPPEPVWTWADQFSTYRFWALSALFCFSSLSTYGLSMMMPFMRDAYSLSIAQIGWLYSARPFAMLLGLFLAWAIARSRTTLPLLLAGALQLTGAVLMAYPSPEPLILLRIVGAFVFWFGYGSTLLAVPAILAGGFGGARHFIIAFGILWSVKEILSLALPAGLGAAGLLSESGRFLPLAVLAAPLLIALAMLAPVRSLFHAPPSPRGYSFVPKRRDPVAVGFLTFIPFYFYYWFYKVHGEIAHLAPSRSLLSPRAAVGACFVPLLLPLVMVGLTEGVNQGAASRGMDRLRSTGGMFWLSLFLAPVATGMLQAAVNRLADAATVRNEAVYL
jgi:MFS family permease